MCGTYLKTFVDYTVTETRHEQPVHADRPSVVLQSRTLRPCESVRGATRFEIELQRACCNIGVAERVCWLVFVLKTERRERADMS
jgi:hypothetical protein